MLVVSMGSVEVYQSGSSVRFTLVGCRCSIFALRFMTLLIKTYM